MSLTDSLGLGGVFGSQASQGTIQNLPAQPGQWVTTASNTSGQTLMGGQMLTGMQSQQQTYKHSTHVLLEENHKLLMEVRDELLDMKKWLIATYPDIYKQYVCVKQLEEASE